MKKQQPKPRPVGRPPGPHGRKARMVGVRLSELESQQLDTDAKARAITQAEALRRAYFARSRY